MKRLSFTSLSKHQMMPYYQKFPEASKLKTLFGFFSPQNPRVVFTYSPELSKPPSVKLVSHSMLANL